jgi:hypothetical protein
MKRLLTAAALALLTTAAQADATLYNGKAWSTFYVSDAYDSHQPICGMMAKLSDAAGGKVMVKYSTTNGVTVQAWKQGLEPFLRDRRLEPRAASGEMTASLALIGASLLGTL